ncbi:MAG TPA: AAA family ATPase [Bryobacteraceae bacterium]|nr:AAA family ATPase [Bryobacteraceae bacterium]
MTAVKDFTEWTEQGGKAEQFRELVEATAPLAEPPPDPKRAATPKSVAAAAATVVENAEDLHRRTLEPLVWLVSGMIPGEGVTVLADRPKRGKSYWVLQAAVAMANGTKFLGRFPTEPARVLYFALEDSERRMQNRLDQVFADEPARRNIDFAFDLKLDVDGISRLEARLETAREEGRPYGAIVIDTFLRACLMRKSNIDAVRADYNEMGALRDLSLKWKLGIVVVHHTRKPMTGDVTSIDQILGTTGLTASADSLIVLGADKEGNRLLSVTGKDTTLGNLLEMEFSGNAAPPWKCLGIYRKFASEMQESIYEILEAGEKTESQLAEELGSALQNVERSLKRMAAAGLLKKVGRQWMLVPDSELPF